MTLPEPIRAFLTSDLHFATIATLDPDGSPRQAVTWYTVDGDDIVLNSLVGRRWSRNLLRDPRIAIAIRDHAYGYHWVGLTGIATPITDQHVARADIIAMARRYHADDPDKVERMVRAYETQERITFRIRPLSVFEHQE